MLFTKSVNTWFFFKCKKGSQVLTPQLNDNKNFEIHLYDFLWFCLGFLGMLLAVFKSLPLLNLWQNHSSKSKDVCLVTYNKMMVLFLFSGLVCEIYDNSNESLCEFDIVLLNLTLKLAFISHILHAYIHFALIHSF